MKNIIEFKDVSKYFGSLKVLDGLNLEVGAGEKLALIGPSGSGKTTILRILMTLETIESGLITVEGKPLWHEKVNETLVPASEAHLQKMRQIIGMVFQQFNLWSHMTVLQNVMEAPVSVLGLEKEKAKKNALDYLNKVGIEEKWNSYPSELSGGQQQRAAIARALCMEPSALLFDEPTSALDPELEQEVIKVIKDLAREGRTMIIVTHDMGLAADVSDHIIFLHMGLIEEEGSPNSLFKSPKSERLQKFLSSTRAA